MATPITLGGMEQGTPAGIATGANLAKYFDRTVGSGSDVEVITAAALSGTYGLRLSPSATMAHAGWQNAGNNGILGSSGTLVGGFRARFVALPTADFPLFIDIGTAGGNDGVLWFDNASDKIRADLGGSSQLGPLLVANTSFWVDFRIILNANPHTFEWAIDGVAQTTVSLAVATENIFIAGFGSDNSNQTGSLDIDDYVISLTSADYPLGPHKVVLLTADTGGSTAEIGTANATGRMVTNSAIDATHNSANILTAVSEVPPLLGGSATGLGQRTSGTGNACGIPMTTYTLAGGETITGVRAVICAWANNATAAANTLGVRTFNGTSETTLFAAAAYQGQNTTTPAWICKMATVADFDTQAELDALVMRIGYSGDIAPLPGVHAVYAEVAVKESTSTDATVTPGTVAAVAAVPSATVQAGAVATPGAVSAVAAVPAPTVRLGAAIAPATVAATASVPAPTIQASQTVAPATVAATTAVPGPTLQAGSIVAPAAVPAVASVAAPVIQAGGTLVQPGSVAAAATVSAPTLQAGAAAAPASVAAVAAVPAPTIHAGSVVAPGTVTAVTTIPTPAVSAGGSAAVSPATVAAAAAIPAPTLNTSSTVTPAAVAATTAIPGPSMQAGSKVTPSTVNAVAAVPALTVQAGTKATPSTVEIGRAHV